MARILSISIPDSKSNLVSSLNDLARSKNRSSSDLAVEALELYLKIPEKVEAAPVCQFCGSKASKLYTLHDDSQVRVCWLHEKKVAKANVKAWKAL